MDHDETTTERLEYFMKIDRAKDRLWLFAGLLFVLCLVILAA